MASATGSRVKTQTTRDRWLRLVGEPDQAVEPAARSEALNRAMNFSLALVALVFVSPLMFFLALAVKLTSRGPVPSPRRV